MYEKHLIINILIDYQIHDNIMMIMNLLNKNFDDDINEIEKSRNFYLSIHLGINTYTSEARFTQSKQYMAGHLVWL